MAIKQSLTHMAQVMKELEVEILANQKKILKLESRLENVADEGVENSEAVKKYQQRVKLLERQLTRERALAEKKISMAAQSAGGNLQNLDLGMGSQISLSFQDEFTHRDVGTNTSLMSTTEVETMIQLAVRPPRNCSTNTALLGSSGTQTDKYHRRNIKFTVGNRYRGVHRAIQTIDFDFSSTQTQTDLVTHREVCCGLSKTDTATVTEAEFYPGMVSLHRIVFLNNYILEFNKQVMSMGLQLPLPHSASHKVKRVPRQGPTQKFVIFVSMMKVKKSLPNLF